MNSTFKFIVVLILALMVVGSLAIKEILNRTPALAEIIPPEQSHYVVYYVVCGALQHVLVTTDPPLKHSMAMVPSQELLDLLKATPREQMIKLTYAGPECFNIAPRQPEQTYE